MTSRHGLWNTFNDKCGSSVELSSDKTTANSSSQEVDSTVFVQISVGGHAELTLENGSLSAIGVTITDPQHIQPLPDMGYKLPKSSVLVRNGNFYINGTRANPPCDFVVVAVGDRIGVRVEKGSRSFVLTHNGRYVAELPTGDMYTIHQPEGEVTTITNWDQAEERIWLVADLAPSSRVGLFIDPVLLELKRTKEDLENRTVELRDLGVSFEKVVDELNTFKRTLGNLEGEREKEKMKIQAKKIENIDRGAGEVNEIKTILEDFLHKLESQNNAIVEKEKSITSEKITKLIKSQTSYDEKLDNSSSGAFSDIIATTKSREECVWFVQNDNLVLIPLNNQHILYTGNCYLIFKQRKLFTWIGAESSLDKRLYIQKVALELSSKSKNGDKLGADNMSILEMEPLSKDVISIHQNDPSEQIFSDQELKGGGVQSIPKHTPRMYLVQEGQTFTVFSPRWANIDQQNVFVVDVGSFIFIWSGRYSSYEQQQGGERWAIWLQTGRSNVNIVDVRGGEEAQIEIGGKEWNIFFPPENKGEIGRNKTIKDKEESKNTLRKVIYEIVKGKESVSIEQIDLLFSANSIGDIIECLSTSTLVPTRNGDIFQASLFQLAIIYKSTHLLQRILHIENIQGYEKNIGNLLSDSVKMYHILDSNDTAPYDIIAPKNGQMYELLEGGELAKGMNAFQLASTFNPDIISEVFGFKQNMKQPKKDELKLETKDIKTILDSSYEYKPSTRLHVFNFHPFLDLRDDHDTLDDVPISSSFLQDILESENTEVQSHLVLYIFNSCMASRLTLLFISWMLSVCFAWSSGQLGLSMHRDQVPNPLFYILTTVLVILMAVLEMFRMIKYFRVDQYIRGRQNWLQWTVIIISVVFLIYIPISSSDSGLASQGNKTQEILSTDDSISNKSILNTLACLCVFGAYSISILLMSKTKTFGIYIIMLAWAAKKTLALLLIYANIISAFAYAFILIIDKSEDVFGSSMFQVFNKILAMMIGELEYSDSFKPDPSPAKQILIQLLFAMFLIAIPILLCNLLIGLTTNDVQKLYKDAIFYQCQNRIKEIVASKARIPKHRRQVCIKEPLRPFKPGYDDVIVCWGRKEMSFFKRMTSFCVLIYQIGFRFLYPANPEPLVLLYEYKSQAAEEGEPISKLPMEYLDKELSLMAKH